MEIEYQMTEEDLIALMQQRIQAKPGLKNPLRRQQLLFAGGFLVMALGSWLFVQNFIYPIVFAVLAVPVYIFFPVYFRWLVKNKVSAAFQNPENRASYDQRILNATGAYLEEKSSQGEYKLKWDGITGLEQTDRYTFIYIQDVPSIIIPRDRLRRGDYETFAKICLENIKAAE